MADWKELRSQRSQVKAKRLALVCLPVVAIITLFAFVLPDKPPRESNLIQNFHTHQAAFERLRDMLMADQQVVYVASWGVETTNSGIAKIPPEGDFPSSRYSEYLALLKQTSCTRAFRIKDKNLDLVGVNVWVHGWYGDTRHINICWTAQKPTNQVGSLDNYYQTKKPRRPVFRQIDGNWYLWADW